MTKTTGGEPTGITGDGHNHRRHACVFLLGERKKKKEKGGGGRRPRFHQSDVPTREPEGKGTGDSDIEAGCQRHDSACCCNTDYEEEKKKGRGTEKQDVLDPAVQKSDLSGGDRLTFILPRLLAYASP